MKSTNSLLKFSVWQALLFCVGCFGVMFILQLIGVWLVAWLYFDDATNMTELLALGSQNGVVIAYSVLFTAITFSLLAIGSILPKTKTLTDTLSFLGIYRFKFQQFFSASVLLVILMVVSEYLTIYFNKTPMAFMDRLLNAQSFYLLIIAVVVIAPIYEELIFRGVLFGVLSHTKVTSSHTTHHHHHLMAAIISSLLFSLVHVQYDWYGLILIFFIGLFFCYIRVRYGLLLSMLMHMMNNAIAMLLYLST